MGGEGGGGGGGGGVEMTSEKNNEEDIAVYEYTTMTTIMVILQIFAVPFPLPNIDPVVLLYLETTKSSLSFSIGWCE